MGPSQTKNEFRVRFENGEWLPMVYPKEIRKTNLGTKIAGHTGGYTCNEKIFYACVDPDRHYTSDDSDTSETSDTSDTRTPRTRGPTIEVGMEGTVMGPHLKGSDGD